MRFTDKVALITAAANGIGRATAEIMVRDGATVIAADDDSQRLDEAMVALHEIGKRSGGKAHAALVNALDQAQVEKLVADVERDHGAIDTLLRKSHRSLQRARAGRWMASGAPCRGGRVPDPIDWQRTDCEISRSVSCGNHV